jgi:AmmeMemoRadiSam system protein B
MAKILSTILPARSLVVASTDFSHQHIQEEAYPLDSMTISAIKDFNFAKLLSFGDDNIDSPAAMAILMYVMQLEKTTTWETWQEGHGAVFSGKPQLVGTSYVTGVFVNNIASN